MIPQLALAGSAPFAPVAEPRRRAAPRTKAAPRAAAPPTRPRAAAKAPPRTAASGAKAAEVPAKRPVVRAKTAASQRTSRILRDLLENNNDRFFTVEKISKALGASSFGTSILVFSVPEVIPIPVPGMSAVVGFPTGIISAQMAAGCTEIRLPNWLLKRSVPRKVLASAIHTILPILERAEKMVRPRGNWVSHPLVKRLLGVFIFLLAITMMLPIPGTNMPPAIAMFITALGMVEKDGLVIALGVLVGLVSMVLIAAIGIGIYSLIPGL